MIRIRIHAIRNWWTFCGFVTVLVTLVAYAEEPLHQDLLTFQTEDAVVVEVASQSRAERSLPEEDDNEVTRSGRQFGGYPGILPVGPCFTSKGVLGRCTSFRQCYPYFKLPDFNNWETWILGMYDTCSYFTASGRQMFGVCCTNPATIRPTQPPRPTPPTTEEPEDEEQPLEPNPNPNPIPPNWPPPIPTHPPDHTIPPLPTHPPSPGWPGLPITEAPVTAKPTKPPTKPTKPTQAPWQPQPWPPATKPTTTKAPWPPAIPTHPTTTRAPWPPAIPTHSTTTRAPWLPTNPPTQAPTLDPNPGMTTDTLCMSRIVGGHSTGPGEWPWIAALFNGGRQFCGGSLIDSTHILTAAHCVAHMSSWDVARLTVRLGDHNIKTNSEVRHIEKKVKRVVRHRGFDSRTLYNDVAILTLDSPVVFTKQVSPICLPSGHDLYAGQTATVIGWGSLRESGPQPAVLQQVSIPIWTNQECRAKYGNAAPGGIVEHFLCAGQANRDSCSGDSGGPLMIKKSLWIQVGIVSWGIGCGKGQYPGVYTRVTHFMPWITKNLK